MRRLIAVIVQVLPVLAGASARAQPVDGADDPTFQSAVAAWLADNDEGALPVLAESANAGNTAARLLLAAIDSDLSLQGPWLALASRDQRLSLLRERTGPSGRSWYAAAARTEPRATAWRKILTSRAGIAEVLALSNLGEARAVRAGLIMLEARQVTGFATYSSDPRFPGALRYLVWREMAGRGEAAFVSSELAGRAAGDGQREVFEGPLEDQDLQAWLSASGLGAPLLELCTHACPQDKGACLLAGYRALGGYRRWLTLGTPVAALISEEDFAASPRGANSVLRRALSLQNLTVARRDELAVYDACFADLLWREGQRF